MQLSFPLLFAFPSFFLCFTLNFPIVHQTLNLIFFFLCCILHLCFNPISKVAFCHGGAIFLFPILYTLLFVKKHVDWKDATVQVSLLPLQKNNGKGLWDALQS